MQFYCQTAYNCRQSSFVVYKTIFPLAILEDWKIVQIFIVTVMKDYSNQK